MFSFAIGGGFLAQQIPIRVPVMQISIMARKVGVAACLWIFASGGTNSQATGAVLVLACSMMELFLRKPYRSPFHNFVARCVLACCLMVLMAGYSVDNRTLRLLCVVGGICIITLCILVGNAVDLYVMFRRYAMWTLAFGRRLTNTSPRLAESARWKYTSSLGRLLCCKV